MPRTIGKPDLNRLRVRFGKDGRLAHLGHIELINTVQRSVRRADLPFSVGNGFARRMRVQFCQALPVGAASLAEYYDLYLTEHVEAEEALAALKQCTPQLLRPTQAAYVGGRLPALEAWLTRSAWTVDLTGTGDAFCAAAVDEALTQLLAQDIIHFMRGDKPRSISLQKTLVGWSCLDATDPSGKQAVALKLETRSSNLGALRPAVLLEAAFKEETLAAATLEVMRVVRQGQWNEGENGELIDPLDPALIVSS